LVKVKPWLFCLCESDHRLQAIENAGKNKYFADLKLPPVNAAKPKGFRGQIREWSDKKSVNWVTDR
jgi:hypothetical protein